MFVFVFMFGLQHRRVRRDVDKSQGKGAPGVKKVALSAAVIAWPELASNVAGRVGRQSIVVIPDAKQVGSEGYEMVIHNATNRTGLDGVESFFGFEGKYRPVLISYPNQTEEEDLLNHARARQ